VLFEVLMLFYGFFLQRILFMFSQDFNSTSHIYFRYSVIHANVILSIWRASIFLLILKLDDLVSRINMRN
jgi:hypothetical protein